MSLAEGKTSYASQMFNGIKLNFAHGLEAPSGLTGYYVPDNGDNDPSDFPTGAPVINDQYRQWNYRSHSANMYAPSMEFVEGTGDDDDVFKLV